MIRLDADDAARLVIDDKEIFPMNLFGRKETIHLTEGLHKFELEYSEIKGVALCYLFWSVPPYREICIIPSDQYYYDPAKLQLNPPSPKTLVR